MGDQGKSCGGAFITLKIYYNQYFCTKNPEIKYVMQYNQIIQASMSTVK